MSAPASTRDALPAHPDLTWRRISLDDVDRCYDLRHAVEVHDAANERTSRAEVLEAFTAPRVDLARNSALGVDADGVARAVCLVSVNPDGATAMKASVDAVVHPQWRGRGLGTAVLDWAVERATGALQAIETDLPRQITGYAEEAHTDRIALLQAAGFRTERWFMDMRRNLADPVPEVRVDHGLVVRPYGAELSEATRLAHNDAFRDHWGSQPVDAERWAHWTGSAASRPEWTVLVLDATAPVEAPVVAGYAVNSAYPHDWAAQGYTEGWTDLLGVRRDYRGRGVAGALLAASMTAFRGAGLEYAGLDVDTENPSGAFGIYARLGYEPLQRSAALVLDVAAPPA